MIKVRAHHLLCIPRFYGRGYVKEGFKKVCSRIRKNPNIKVKIVGKFDDICIKCPCKKGKICSSPKVNSLIMVQDNKVLKKLKLKENTIHKAKDILNYSINNITKNDIKTLCKSCLYIKLCLKWGVNNSFFKDLNK